MRQPIVRQGFGYYRALLSDPDETDRLTAVNRRVAGSNPARGAITILYKATLAPQTPLVARHQQPVSDVRDDGNRRGARAADRLNFAAPGISPRDDKHPGPRGLRGGIVPHRTIRNDDMLTPL